MIEESDLIFREEQRFALWLRLLLVVSMVAAVGFSCFALGKMAPQQGPSEILPIILLIATGVGVPIVIAILFLVVRLETEVRSAGLYVRLFPFHIRYKKFTAEDLSECCARTYRPILEYGGWGIRYGKNGKAYNVSGNQGVQLVLKTGKPLLIGSQKPDELAEAISSIMVST